MIRWYANGGKRYYVIDVPGYGINPASGRCHGSSRRAGVTYAVLDRDNMHIEVGRFAQTGGRTRDKVEKLAKELAAELNAMEAA